MITKNEILLLEDKLYEAMKNRSLEDLNDLLHPDLLFMIPSGQTITKEMDLQTYRDGSLKIAELTPQVEELNIIDDLAVITIKMHLKGNYNNGPFEAKFKYIRFWKKFPDGIKVVGGSGIAV